MCVRVYVCAYYISYEWLSDSQYGGEAGMVSGIALLFTYFKSFFSLLALAQIYEFSHIALTAPKAHRDELLIFWKLPVFFFFLICFKPVRFRLFTHDARLFGYTCQGAV